MLATLADLKTYLGVTDNSEDAVLTVFLNRAIAQAKNVIGRDIEKPGSDYVEELDGHGENVIHVRNYPIISVASVEYFGGIDWIPFDPAFYSVKKKTGQIRFPYSQVPRGFGNIRVTYLGGYDPVPADLSEAVVRIAASVYNRRNSDGIKREKIEGAEIEYSSEAVPQDALSVIESYRSIDV